MSDGVVPKWVLLSTRRTLAVLSRSVWYPDLPAARPGRPATVPAGECKRRRSRVPCGSPEGAGHWAWADSRNGGDRVLSDKVRSRVEDRRAAIAAVLATHGSICTVLEDVHREGPERAFDPSWASFSSVRHRLPRGTRSWTDESILATSGDRASEARPVCWICGRKIHPAVTVGYGLAVDRTSHGRRIGRHLVAVAPAGTTPERADDGLRPLPRGLDSEAQQRWLDLDPGRSVGALRAVCGLSVRQGCGRSVCSTRSRLVF